LGQFFGVDQTIEMAATSRIYRKVRRSGETILFGPDGYEPMPIHTQETIRKFTAGN